MSWLTDLRNGIATATAAESGGLLTFRATGVYTAAQVGIHGLVLPAEPVEAVAMNLLVLVEGAETVVECSFRFRAARESRLDTIEDALSNCWTERRNGTLNGVKVIQSQWASGASLGQDSNGRLSRSINFNITAHRALTYRT